MDAGLKAPLVTGKGYFLEKYGVEDIRATYLGTGFDEGYLKEKGIRHVECDGLLKLAEGCTWRGNFTRRYAFETIPERFQLRDGDGWKPDHFNDEICLVHQLKEGLFVLVGCSPSGHFEHPFHGGGPVPPAHHRRGGRYPSDGSG